MWRPGRARIYSHEYNEHIMKLQHNAVSKEWHACRIALLNRFANGKVTQQCLSPHLAETDGYGMKRGYIYPVATVSRPMFTRGVIVSKQEGNTGKQR